MKYHKHISQTCHRLTHYSFPFILFYIFFQYKVITFYKNKTYACLSFNTKMLKPTYTKEHTCHMVIIFQILFSIGLSLDNQQKEEKLIDTKDQIIIYRKSNMHLVSVQILNEMKNSQ